MKIMLQQHELIKYDLVGKKEDISYLENILIKYSCKDIESFMSLHPAKLEGDYEANRVRRVLTQLAEIVRMRKPKTCNCGAKHTSFPNHHYGWCETREV